MTTLPPANSFSYVIPARLPANPGLAVTAPYVSPTAPLAAVVPDPFTPSTSVWIAFVCYVLLQTLPVVIAQNVFDPAGEIARLLPVLAVMATAILGVISTAHVFGYARTRKRK